MSLYFLSLNCHIRHPTFLYLMTLYSVSLTQRHLTEVLTHAC